MDMHSSLDMHCSLCTWTEAWTCTVPSAPPFGLASEVQQQLLWSKAKWLLLLRVEEVSPETSWSWSELVSAQSTGFRRVLCRHQVWSLHNCGRGVRVLGVTFSPLPPHTHRVTHTVTTPLLGRKDFRRFCHIYYW